MIDAGERFAALRSVRLVRQALEARSFSWTDEADLQAAVEGALRDDGLQFEREVELSARSRVDFLVSRGVAVELKTDGSLTEVTRQLHRYALHDDVSAVVLVTTRMRHRAVPAKMGGKPCQVVYLPPL